jgi:hypothetical protein
MSALSSVNEFSGGDAMDALGDLENGEQHDRLYGDT